jgi:hypothetical protein
MSYPRKWAVATAAGDHLKDLDWDAMVDAANGMDLSGYVLQYPFSYIIRKVGGVYDAVDDNGVQTFGGSGDAGGVDGAVFADVLQATITNTLAGGKIILFLDSADVTKEITGKSNITIEGLSTTAWGISSVRLENANTLTKMIDLDSVNFMTLKNIRFSSDGVTNDVAIHFGAGSSWITIDGCIFENFAVGIKVTTDGYGSRIINSIWDDTRTRDIEVNGTNFNWCTLQRNVFCRAVDIVGGGSINIWENDFESVATTYFLMLEEDCDGVSLMANRVEAAAGSDDITAFYFKGKNIKCYGGQVFEFFGAVSTSPAIYVNNTAVNVEIEEENCSFIGFDSNVGYQSPTSIISKSPRLYAHTEAMSISFHLGHYPSGSIHTNFGASNLVELFLPHGTIAGQTYIICVEAAFALRLKFDYATSAFYAHAAKQADDSYLGCNAVVGSCLTVVADGNDDWIVTSETGTWTVDAP